jgi:hypothetical protein
MLRHPSEKLYEDGMRRVRVLEDRLGSEHPLVARNLSNLGVLFYRLNRCKEAKPLFRRALAILEKTYGTENALAASALTKCSGASIATNAGMMTRRERSTNDCPPSGRFAGGQIPFLRGAWSVDASGFPIMKMFVLHLGTLRMGLCSRSRDWE